MPSLDITDPNGKNWSAYLNTDRPYVIGRAPACDVVLDDARVSRYHAFIRYEDGFFVLVDGRFFDGKLYRSANKIFVNGEACSERRLSYGDQITIGACTLRFEEHRCELPPR